MKQSISLKSIFSLVLICLFCTLINAQEKNVAKDKNKNLNIEVKGNCGMCKTRIEKAALKIKGVKYAQWDIPSNQLTLVINENKCSPQDIKKAIAAVGHDTDDFRATDEVYHSLPPCCQFRDPNSINMDHGTNH